MSYFERHAYLSSASTRAISRVFTPMAVDTLSISSLVKSRVVFLAFSSG